MSPRRGVFPGTFNPPTIAHLAIAEAAQNAHQLQRVDLVLSRNPIGKDVVVPTFEQRLGVLEAVASTREWLEIVVTEDRLIADIASGYDIVIMGADKWHQVNDVAYYDNSAALRDDAVARLPTVALFDRDGHEVHATVALDPGYRSVSSSLARAGAHHLMVPEALESGLWSE